jgi:hypothetical protein
MFYPCDAITLSFITPANSGVVLLPATTTPRTILNALDTNYLTSGDMYLTVDGIILVDATPNLRQDNRFLTLKTKGEIVAHNSALSGNASGQIVYVERDIASSSPVCAFTASTTGNYINGFTYGDILISFFLFLIILGFVFSFIIHNFLTNKIK